MKELDRSPAKGGWPRSCFWDLGSHPRQGQSRRDETICSPARCRKRKERIPSPFGTAQPLLSGLLISYETNDGQFQRTACRRTPGAKREPAFGFTRGLF